MIGSQERDACVLLVSRTYLSDDVDDYVNSRQGPCVLSHVLVRALGKRFDHSQDDHLYCKAHRTSLSGIFNEYECMEELSQHAEGHYKKWKEFIGRTLRFTHHVSWRIQCLSMKNRTSMANGSMH